ncbi:MAG: hypothetical protein AABZ67_14585 [Pseudomonadota bacterium]
MEEHAEVCIPTNGATASLDFLNAVIAAGLRCFSNAISILFAFIGCSMPAFQGKCRNSPFNSRANRGAALNAARRHATEHDGVQALGAHLALRLGLKHRCTDMAHPASASQGR